MLRSHILISAGRYGSIHPETGLSYTEMEYGYAVETGKPIIRLLHKDPFNELKGEFIEKTAKGRKLLQQFRKKLITKPQRMVKFWTNEHELGSAVDHSLRHLIKTKPAIGWAKASEISTKDSRFKIADLNEENNVLRENLSIFARKDFHPILDGLDGAIDLVEYECSRVKFSASEAHFSGSNIAVADGHEYTLYSPTDKIITKAASWVIQKICFHFLHETDFETAAKTAFLSAHSVGNPESRLLYPTTENDIEPLFMAIEGAGLIKPGSSMNTTMLELVRIQISKYLRGARWELSDEFRQWLAKNSSAYKTS